MAGQNPPPLHFLGKLAIFPTAAGDYPGDYSNGYSPAFRQGLRVKNCSKAAQAIPLATKGKAASKDT
jgi:hypothetical protein